MSQLPLSVLLNQLSLELGALQLMAADMEATVDDMIERHATVLDARSIQNLQLLDILNQTLLALAQWIGEHTGATVGYLGEAGNAVGAQLVSDAAAIVPGQPFTVALRLQHDPHWHSYWIAPGTGYPTSLAWTLPEGFKAGEIQIGRAHV